MKKTILFCSLSSVLGGAPVPLSNTIMTQSGLFSSCDNARKSYETAECCENEKQPYIPQLTKDCNMVIASGGFKMNRTEMFIPDPDMGGMTMAQAFDTFPLDHPWKWATGDRSTRAAFNLFFETQDPYLPRFAIWPEDVPMWECHIIEAMPSCKAYVAQMYSSYFEANLPMYLSVMKDLNFRYTVPKSVYDNEHLCDVSVPSQNSSLWTPMGMMPSTFNGGPNDYVTRNWKDMQAKFDEYGVNIKFVPRAVSICPIDMSA